MTVQDTNTKNLQEINLTVKLRLSKPLKELTDLVGGRLWTMDGIEDVTVALMDPSQTVNSTDAPVTLPGKQTFEDKIRAFNKLYGLPVGDVPSVPPGMNLEGFLTRMDDFKNILIEELDEVEAIKAAAAHTGGSPERILELLTELADWLGDIQVYCASEAIKFGLPNDLILSIIMASNMSKLGEDGKPIYDERGKVMKGPGYWRPEPQIKRALQALIRQNMMATDTGAVNGNS